MGGFVCDFPQVRLNTASSIYAPFVLSISSGLCDQTMVTTEFHKPAQGPATATQSTLCIQGFLCGFLYWQKLLRIGEHELENETSSLWGEAGLSISS